MKKPQTSQSFGQQAIVEPTLMPPAPAADLAVDKHQDAHRDLEDERSAEQRRKQDADQAGEDGHGNDQKKTADGAGTKQLPIICGKSVDFVRGPAQLLKTDREGAVQSL